MFEDRGTTAAQRKEKAKAERIKLKALQEKKDKYILDELKKREVAETEIASSAEESISASISLPPIPPATLPIPSSTPISNPTSITHTPTSSFQTAAFTAAAARKDRSLLRKQTTSIITIQSLIRKFQSSKLTLTTRLNEFDSKIKTIVRVSDLKLVDNYVPPPASCSYLTTLLLAIIKSSSSSSPSFIHSGRLTSLLVNVLTPGLASSDASLNVVSTWLDYGFGRIKFDRLLQTCCQCLANVTSIGDGDDVIEYSKVTSFLTLLIEGRNRDVAKYVLSNLFISNLYLQKNTSDNNSVIRILRQRLMSASTKTKTNSLLFKFMLDSMYATSTSQNRDYSDYYYGEFAILVLSVPLLQTLMVANVDSMSTLTLLMTGDAKLLTRMCKSVLRKQHSNQLPTSISALLPMTNLKITPCPSNLALFANLITLIRSSPLSSPSWNTSILTLLTNLLNEIPLSTLTNTHNDKQSIVWIHEGVSSTPVVLNERVCEIAKYATNEVFVRKVCNIHSSKGEGVSEIDSMLNVKNDADKTQETLLTTTTTSASMASADAAPDKKKTFMESKWGRRISSFMSGGGSGKVEKRDVKGGSSGVLVDTSRSSRSLASRSNAAAAAAAADVDIIVPSTPTPTKATLPLDLKEVTKCTPFLSILTSRWGGSGNFDIIARRSRPLSDPLGSSDASSTVDLSVNSLVNVLCFSTNIIRLLWGYIISDEATVAIESFLSSGSFHSLSSSSTSTSSSVTVTMTSILVFAALLSNALIVTDDSEMHDKGRPLPLHHIRRVIVLFKRLLFKACSSNTSSSSSHEGISLTANVSRVMRDLYTRSSRRPICTSSLWHVDSTSSIDKHVDQCKTLNHAIRLLNEPLFNVMPYAVKFKVRLKLFETLIRKSREDVQGSHSNSDLRQGIGIKIHRDRVLEDGLTGLNSLGSRLRERLVVSYVNSSGLQESGIDVGGLFKEFWVDLCALAFSPDYALFCSTSDSNGGEGASSGAGALFPNHLSLAAHGSDHTILFSFLGKILGKALFEGITIQPVFAHFFLSFMKGDYNYMHMLQDLSTLDAELYKNLMFLKGYEGDAADLCLTFSIVDDSFGAGREIDLVTNGANVDVTDKNKLRYIHLVAKYHMSDKIRSQASSFSNGLHEVIPKTWLKIFSEQELQILISGASGGKINVNDMKTNCKYVGGYSGFDKNIVRFWRVVEGFTVEQQAMLLKFTTSCERPPPMGFCAMIPAFTIMRISIRSDAEKLPSASTCFNVLKLPTYSSEKVMREKLLLSITSGAGFELS